MIILLLIYAQGKLILDTNYYSRIYSDNYAIAPFGHVPYSSVIFGTFINANSTLCDTSRENVTYDMWLMVKQGGCSLATKAYNAQQLGSGLIAVQADIPVNKNTIIEEDDGLGVNVIIPVIVLGDELHNVITRAFEKSPFISAAFNFKTEIYNVQNKSYIFGLDIQNRETFKFIRDFKDNYLNLRPYLNISIYYVIELAILKSDANLKEDCIEDKYCTHRPQGSNATGKHILFEILRQSCLFHINQSDWYQYMVKFDEYCLDPLQYGSCFEKYASHIEEAQKCMINNSTTIFAQQLQMSLSSGIIFYPGLSLNNQIVYQGFFDSKGVTEFMCEAFEFTEDQPSVCLQYFQIKTEESYTGIIIFSIIFAILVSILLYLYRRHLKAQMQSETRVAISNAISNFMNKPEVVQDSYNKL